ncbi:CHY zinc finger protein [Gracilibacillus salinarum]|uniref:CHY zinc finger protein n=1 Tax=Gracilibacillus salinarum TaxID=2932255 RepID=A0ABY4GH24_9BACI|nr:CHY zinc finger protein [Gracilibacillus salinarum]UOQ83451.1 CHY zinc finger protein [Gracilibacillus salinarum]
MKKIHGVHVHGAVIDQETRCKHYRLPEDIVAIKFKCCNTHYPCYKCHEEEADHPAEVWPEEEYNQQAILCGKCGTALTISAYMQCDSACPHCGSSFNPGCRLHSHLYFSR